MKYYEEHHMEYIAESMTFDLSVFYKFSHEFFEKIQNKQGRALDIGFGSARDIAHFQETYGLPVLGIDSTESFVRIANDKGFDTYPRVLPNIDLEGTFDIVYSVAVLFHLNEMDRAELIESIDEITVPGSVVIHSYNELDRTKDKERSFYLVKQEEVDMLMEKHGFEKIKEEIMWDKREFRWITTAYVKK